MAQFCYRCGAQFSDDQTNCPECGAGIGLGTDEKRYGPAVASMVLGIVSAFISGVATPFLFIFDVPVLLIFLGIAAGISVLGIVLGCRAMHCSFRAMARSGFCTALPSLVVSTASMVVYLILFLVGVVGV